MSRRGSGLLIGALLLTVTAGGAQTAMFESVSIKPNTSGDARMSLGMRGRSHAVTNAPLRFVLADAFELTLERDRLVGGPSWIGADRFDIVATMPEAGTRVQLPEMLQSMLADRFHLVAHRELRDAAIYALVVARSDGRLGAKLRKAPIDCEALRAAGSAIPQPAAGREPLCAAQIDDAILGRGQRLAALARMLTQFAGRTVVDRTGLSGPYDFDLRLPEQNAGRRPPGEPGSSAANDPAGGILTVLQDELGLRLEATRGPLEFVVIDSIERPAAN